MMNNILGRKPCKATLLEVQKLCGTLNFFCRCIIPGRAFTRRLYSLTKGTSHLKPHHHVSIKSEHKKDIQTWEQFLLHPSAFCRDFTYFNKILDVQDLAFYTDASRNKFFGAGGYCQKSWFMIKWNSDFMEQYEPSINYLELYGVTVAILLWIHKFANKKVAIFCDNTSVISMINNNTSSCKNCMVLIRLIVLKCMIHNVRVFVKYVSSKNNAISDSLSRMQIDRFLKLTQGKFDQLPTAIPNELWPMEKIWLK